MNRAFFSKLKYVGLVLVAAVIASVSLCVNVNAATTMKYDPQMTDEELRQAIVECNKISEVLDAGEYYQEIRVQGIDPVHQIYNVSGSDHYIFREADWNEYFVDTRLASYGYFAIFPGKKIVRLHDDELWKFATEGRAVGSLDEVYNPYEYYTERYIKNGMLYTRARTSLKGYPKDVLEVDGVDVSRKIDFVEIFREIDPDTLVIRKNIEYVKYSDEDELIPFVYCIMGYYKENPRKDKANQLYNDIFGGEKHTIKIITKIGTTDEREYSIAANKDAYLDYWIRSSDRSYNIFVDPECTIPAELDEDGLIKFDSDKILYMK